MATVSLCMIVKNEERVLARCLESVRECMDEIIIVDTGSSDGTKEIAARYTDKIYDFEWIDDFAAARNFSFSKASMDFAMWLDADDVFLEADKNAFIELKNSIPDNVDVVMLRYHTAFDEEGKPVFSYYRERLIRKGTVSFWKGRVHEVIVHTGRVMYSEVAVTHRSEKRATTTEICGFMKNRRRRGSRSLRVTGSTTAGSFITISTMKKRYKSCRIFFRLKRAGQKTKLKRVKSFPTAIRKREIRFLRLAL